MSQMEDTCCNVAEVERDSTAAILHAILRATISGVDTRCNLAIARNIARNVAPCVQAFNTLEVRNANPEAENATVANKLQSFEACSNNIEQYSPENAYKYLVCLR